MSTQIVPPPPWWRKWALAAAAAVLVVGVAVGGVVVRDRLEHCGDGVVHSGPYEECTGLTDGSVIFAPELRDLEERIRRENDDVAGSGVAHVSIAVLLPMTLRGTGDEIVTKTWVRHQLEGAHLGQLAANHATTWGSQPRIRLLLANAGSGLAQWKSAVDELEKRRDREHIVAVTGIGLSVGNAVSAMRRLAESRMPMVGSTLTADDLSTIPGLLRVSPTNTAQARAAAAFIKPDAHRALLVRDENPEDHYPQTLADEFTVSFPDATHGFSGPTEKYDSRDINVDNTFQYMMPNVCHAAPEVVYFAGRARHAVTFIKALADRGCPKGPITVLTGDDMASYAAPDDAIQTALDSGVSVVYTGLAHPQAWQSNKDAFNLHSIAQFAAGCQGRVCYRELSSDGLEDAAAITGYDAVATAVQAIRQAAGAAGNVVRAEDVLQSMNRLHGTTAVLGASGTLDFDEVGNPVDKPVPMLRVLPGKTPEFLRLSLPD
ncbi:ABC-type branched-subunit amino acid transport system substrate-binding protein [Nocardia tenerifensis]|uniref:ABC-type branched-subunit amino acid transport system substrate-binding protein n=2 Tax=Nocardia tenerifensis TaxID=228006 RepID=A0A318JSV7_9NOCA|nr:ABC transporter substrate-binding protein [Nocardia tenerifensis]PXX59307.1 ABC-type branched-subunit amino acid transport system substrate-binding protein [Nocardia tenerifensis]